MKQYIFAFLADDANFKITGYAVLLAVVAVGKFLLVGHL